MCVCVYVYMWPGGYPPFSDVTTMKLYRNIQLGVFEFHHDYWKDVSAEAKDLISSLIQGTPHSHIHTYIHVYLQLAKIPYIYSTYVCMLYVCMYVYYRVMKIFAKNE